MKLRKTGYYAGALRSLLGVMRNRGALLPLALGREVLVEFSTGPRLWMSRPLDLLIYKEVCLDDEYGLGALDAPACIVDVGAGIGEFAVAAARRFPGARVVSFEPDPERFELLRRNVAINDCANVELHGAAVGTHSFPLSRLAWHPIDMLKIDCEGAELDVLHSIDAAQFDAVARVVLEYHDFDGERRSDATRAFLAARGFDVTVIANRYEPRIGHVDARRAGKRYHPSAIP